MATWCFGFAPFFNDLFSFFESHNQSWLLKNSEASLDPPFQQIIKAAIQAQDYDALEDFLSVDDLIVNEITSEVGGIVLNLIL